MRVNKDRVRLRFSKASGTYDQQGVVQLQVARQLLKLLETHLSHPPTQILEIGCCTGLLTERLFQQFPQMTTFYANDLVPDFQTIVYDRLGRDSRFRYLPGDIEKLDIPANIDLVVSSSTLHWLEDLPALFSKLAQKITADGTLCFSIYGVENLLEIRALTGVGLNYYPTRDLQRLVSEHFDIITCTEEKITLHFTDPLAVLNHLRETGVNAIDQLPWTRKRLNLFLQEYGDRFREGNGVVLTYHPVYCLACKKG